MRRTLDFKAHTQRIKLLSQANKENKFILTVDTRQSQVIEPLTNTEEYETFADHSV